MASISDHNSEEYPASSDTSRVYYSKSVQLPYGFYTRHLDNMT